TTAAALAGEALALTACEDVDLTEGETILRTAVGREVGLSIDRIVLRSAKDGTAPDATGALTEPPVTEGAGLQRSDGTHITGTITVEGTGDAWLVFGQSINPGWVATVDGQDLGPPTLVNGYAAGWRIPDDARGVLQLDLRFSPQRRVDIALA